MNIRAIITFATLLAAALSAAALNHDDSSTAFDGNDETLTYNVMFKWGLINKKAGSATLTLRNQADRYVTQLTAASEPWADRFYEVRDTLNGIIDKKDFRPLFYEKIANEGGDHKHDVVNYKYNEAHPDSGIIGLCTRKVYKKGKLKVDEQRELTSDGTTVDMLTSFYFMRHLPYDTWTPGHSEVVTIFSGKQKERLAIDYSGIVNLKVGDSERPCYHITFVFTSDGSKKTSDDMEAWISADNRRLPMRLEGKLPVGKVHCILASE